MTIRQLIEEQRQRVRSSDPAERFAAALLLPAELAKCLRTLSGFRLGELLEHEVCANLNLLAPELTICSEAADRLRRTPSLQRNKLRADSSVLDGEHLLHAESALYHAGIPNLLLPFQRDRFASSTIFLRDIEQARSCLLESGFRKSSRSPALLIDGQTGRPIQLYEDRQNFRGLSERRRTPSA